jgi:hypothetical protein
VTNRPIPIKLWSQAQLHRLYDDVVMQAIPVVMQEQLQRLAELELEEEERNECPK